MKRTRTILFLFLFAVTLTFTAQAEQADEWDSVSETFDLDSLTEATPDDVVTIVEELDILPDDAEGSDTISLLDAVKARMLTLFSQELAPLRTLRVLIGLSLLAFVGKAIAGHSDCWQYKTAEMLIMIACGVLLMSPLSDLFESVSESVRASVIYQRALLPVYAGLLTASGHTTLSSVYSVLLLGYDQIVSTVNDQVFVPLCRMLLSLIICLPMSGTQSFSLQAVRKGVVSVLTSLNGICTALLMAQARVSAVTDRVVVKATKASLAALVPIVGTTLSESLSVILNSIDLAKTTVGVYTIVTVTLLFLPPLIRLLLWKLSLWLSAALFDAVGANKEKTMIRSVSALLTILISIALSCAVFLILTSIIVMSAGVTS